MLMIDLGGVFLILAIGVFFGMVMGAILASPSSITVTKTFELDMMSNDQLETILYTTSVDSPLYAVALKILVERHEKLMGAADRLGDDTDGESTDINTLKDRRLSE